MDVACHRQKHLKNGLHVLDRNQDRPQYVFPRQINVAAWYIVMAVASILVGCL